jgi:N6-adenosine-specific RNA methylase IME4
MAGSVTAYQTILADPPWPVKGDAILRPWVMGAGGRRKRATVMPYSLMPLEDIYALPVGSLAAPDAHLYLWTTVKLNARGIGKATAEAWGFEWVGEIVWKKPNFGLGAFPRPQHEILVIARRGKLPFNRRNVGSVQEWKQDYTANGGKRHSVKPDACQDLIESNSPGPYLEMFARRQRLGWDTWGNEALNHVGCLKHGREDCDDCFLEACTA